MSIRGARPSALAGRELNIRAISANVVEPRAEFAAAVRAGLDRTPRTLPTQYVYDERGSALFAQMCDDEAYYPTRCEAEILTANAARLAASCGAGSLDLVDLGAGDGRKTRIVLEGLVAAGVGVRYVPIDISRAALTTAVQAMQRARPGIECLGLSGDYVQALEWLGHHSERERLVLFLGSNIGNFTRSEAEAFLGALGARLAPADRLLVGFDLRKSVDLLMKAYAGPDAIASRLTLNILDRINRELGGEFDRSSFDCHTLYRPDTGAVEFHIVATRPQRVRIAALDRVFDFAQWSSIHVTSSHKYHRSEIDAIALAARLRVEAVWTDPAGWFCDAVLRCGPR